MAPAVSPFVSQQLKLRMMIEKYRSIGHQFASIDPLNQPKSHFVGSIDPKEISMESFEFTQSELDLKYDLKSSRKADA